MITFMTILVAWVTMMTKIMMHMIYMSMMGTSFWLAMLLASTNCGLQSQYKTTSPVSTWKNTIIRTFQAGLTVKKTLPTVFPTVYSRVFPDMWDAGYLGVFPMAKNMSVLAWRSTGGILDYW